MLRIAATIVVERDSHKAMVIGEGGEKLKRIGTEARQELERLLDAKVFLQTVREGPLGLGRRRGQGAQLRLRVMSSRIELLQAMPMFGGVREETLTFLLGLSRPGGFFFREDDEAQSMFVLESGRRRWSSTGTASNTC
jgi:hypothetical protein